MQRMHPVFIFSVLEVENENAAAWNGVPAAEKMPGRILRHLSYSCYSPIP